MTVHRPTLSYWYGGFWKIPDLSWLVPATFFIFKIETKCEGKALWYNGGNKLEILTEGYPDGRFEKRFEDYGKR